MNVSFMSNDQLHLICAEADGYEPLNVTRTAPGEWETFEAEHYGGNLYAFRYRDKGYITALGGGGGPLVIRWPWEEPGHAPGGWELFRVRAFTGFSFQCENGTYWSAAYGGGGALTTKHPWDTPGHTPGPDESFFASIPLHADDIGEGPSYPPTPPPPEPGPIPPAPVPAGGLGGIRLHAADVSVRPRFSARQMHDFIPSSSGGFIFPIWNSIGVRVTNGETIRPIGMAYWPNVYDAGASLHVFLSVEDMLTLYIVDRQSLQVREHEPLPFHETGEGCYWGSNGLLYVPLRNRLERYDVTSGRSEVVFEADNVQQCHSSADGKVHSFTMNGSAAVFERGRIRPFPAERHYDECQIDKSGRWLLVKEANDNRVIDLQTGNEHWLQNENGAVGHSDMGFGYVVGEDDYAPQAGAFRLWQFTPGGPADGRLVYHMHGWEGMTRYVSHCNARPGSPASQPVLYSSASDDDRPRANALVVSDLSGSLQCIEVCSSLTDLQASGGGETYWKLPRANLDATGQWACWTANHGTDRLDAFLVRIPPL